MNRRWSAVLLLLLGAAVGFGARLDDAALRDSLRYLPPNIRSYYLDKAGFDMWPAAQPRPESTGLRLIGKWGAGPSVRVTGRDSIVYLSRGSEVVVINFADTANPRVLTTIQAPGLVARSILVGNRLYVSSGYIETFDVSDPAHPVKLGSILARAPAIDVIDTLVYTLYRDSFKVFNFADPANPVMLGACRDSGYDLSVCKGYAYVGDGGGLYVLDVTNPASPHRVASWGSDVIGVRARTTICCVTTDNPNNPGELRFTILDMRNPSSPTPLGSLNSCGGYDIFLDDSLAFLSGYYTGGHEFQIVGIGDTLNPTRIGSCNTPGDNFGVWADVSHNQAYVADDLRGLAVLNITNLNSPRIDTTLLRAGISVDVSIDGHYAYVASSTCGLLILDVADPTRPAQVGALDGTVSIDINAVTARDSFAFVGWAPSMRTLHTIDVSDPTNPTWVGGDTLFNVPEDMVLRDSFLYVAEDNKFQVVNVARPREPAVVGTCGLQFDTYGICLDDTLAYVASYPFAVVNVRDPASPVVVGTITRGACNGSVRDTFLFMSSGGVVVYSVSDPTQPTVLDSISPGTNTAWVEPVGSLLYTGHRDGVRVVDASDVHNMHVRGFGATPFGVNRLRYSSPYLYAACYDAGICIFESTQVGVNDNDTCAQVGPEALAWPNPTRGLVHLSLSSTSYGLAVRDVTGRALHIPTAPGRSRRTELDMSSLPSGVYFIEVRTGAETKTGKVIIQ